MITSIRIRAAGEGEGTKSILEMIVETWRGALLWSVHADGHVPGMVKLH